MSEFTASNGVQVRPGRFAGLHITCNGDGKAHDLSDGETGALREYFQHERDDDLGRWRWPDDPSFVVYGAYSPGEAQKFARVVNEITGVAVVVYERGSDIRPQHPAATAFFDAHPERKPWEDAKPGDVWVFTYFGEVDVVVIVTGGFPFGVTFRTVAGTEYNTKNPHITSARRIWPEVSA